MYRFLYETRSLHIFRQEFVFNYRAKRLSAVQLNSLTPTKENAPFKANFESIPSLFPYGEVPNQSTAASIEPFFPNKE